MKIPTPSFLRIRIKILILSLFILFFVIGFVKDCFSQIKQGSLIDGKCYMPGIDVTDTATKGWDQYHWALNYREYGIVWASNDDMSLVTQGSQYKNVRIHIFRWDYSNPQNGWSSIQAIWVYSVIGGVSEQNIQQFIDIPSNYESWYPANQFPNGPPANCGKDPCEAAAEDLTSQCGGPELVAWEWTDQSTCTGRCLPCSINNITEGQETYQEAVTRCLEQEQSVSYYDENICLGICSNCSTEQYLASRESCGQLRYTFNNVTCEAICDSKCDPEFAKGAADIYCSTENKKAISYTCSASPERGYYLVDGSVTCGNPDDLTQLPNTSEPGEEKPADPAEPDPTEPAPDPTDPTDNNQWNQAIKSDLDKLIGQNDKLSADNKKQEALLDWIGDNAKTTADNTNAIAKSLQDGSAKVSLDSQSLGALNGIGEGIGNLEGALNGVEDGIGSLEGILEGIAGGTLNPSPGPGPYTVPEHNFTERTYQFLEDLKETSLFSIPRSLYQAIPSGGDSRVVIETGSTFGGNHTVDFNYLSEALTILKYIFQIAGMTIAIRIVTLKR